MQIVPWIVFVAVTAEGLIACQPATTDTFEERHRQELSPNPADLHFVLRITTGQSQFHQGEMIPITLEFSSDTPDKYRLDAGTYDRGGRLWSEEFVLDRDDVADPLADYIGSGVIGGMAGGIRGMPTLARKPVDIKLHLNDWFRFDRPGRYRLFLKSHRLTRERLPQEPGSGLIEFAAVSNILEIRVSEPDPQWEAAKLSQLRAVLETHAATEDKIVEAEQELGYLGTTDAVRAMFILARTNVFNLDAFALIRSPHRAFVIAEMDRYLEDPKATFSEWDIRTRALFDFVQRHPKPFAPTSRSEARNFNWEQRCAECEMRQKEFDQILRRRAVQLIAATERKSPEARGQCVQVLAALAPEEAKAAGLVPADDYGLTRSELIAGFSGFPPERKSALLTDKWNLVRGPEMLPALRQVIANESVEAPAIRPELWLGPMNLAEEALDRLQELAPDEARLVLLEDVARPHPRFAYMAMHELPAQDVPKADASIAARLTVDFLGTLPLAAKFATRQLMEQIRQQYSEHFEICAAEQPFVAYIVRVDAAEGKRVLAHAMADREKRGCFHWLLSGVANVVWNPVVEQQAIATLEDPDPQAAADAAATLAAHGGPEIEPLLWRRLERWSQQWRGKEDELRPHPITRADPHMGDRMLGEALFNAISKARAWIVDPDRARRLAALCIDDGCRGQWIP